MLKQIKAFMIGVIFTVIATVAITSVLGAETQKTITAIYDNIKIYIDGNLISPKDANGNMVEPFRYNGTTYLPVRAIGEAFNKPVDWDGATQSIYIGVRPGTAVRLSEQIKPYTKSSRYYEYPEKGSFKMAGQQYYSGVVNNGNSNEHALYNLDGLYEQLSGVYGPTDRAGSNAKCTINFYGDDKLLKSLETKYGDLPKDFSVDLCGVLQLKIEFKDGYNFGIGNVQIR